jgi:hypothetical protein
VRPGRRGAAAVDEGLIAIGGWCTRIDDEGGETDLAGSFLFQPPEPPGTASPAPTVVGPATTR